METKFKYKYDTQIIQRRTTSIYKKNGTTGWNPVCVNKRAYVEFLK